MAVVAFELVGSADGLVEFADPLDQVGVLFEEGLAFLLVLFDLVDLGGLVADSFGEAAGDLSAVFDPGLAALLESVAGGLEVMGGPPPVPPSQPFGLYPFLGHLELALGGQVAAGGDPGGVVFPAAPAGEQVGQFLGVAGAAFLGVAEFVLAVVGDLPL